MRILPTPIDVNAPVVRAAGPVDVTDPQDFPIEEIWAASGGVVYLTVIGGLKAHMRLDHSKPYSDRTSWEWHVPDDAVRIWVQQECETCDGDRWIEDPTACGDEDHCSPVSPCPTCNPEGDAS